jgi:aerobic-type carbon monoxide dehydrogenase small subunit (CoxS/CutS family)/carbon monoxide dehydrogenase subunit G
MTEARAVRVTADEPVETRLTVNGNEATLRLPARVTLADALREHLGLTGTHLGCEHGVCGMCTVLVDGVAARACLLFACQLDGSEVLTVEGLGRPDELHPLQQAFTEHHALQCGFCTPGFLLSAYDLLSSKPGVTREELPVELSGVICRCTGYRNIVDAVAETAEQYPQGIPAPGNCAHTALLGRAGGRPSGGAPAPAETTSEEAAEDTQQVEITLPSGEPTVTVEIRSPLDQPFGKVWRVLADPGLLIGCLPGAEMTADLGDDGYRGRARVSVGPIKLSFTGVAKIIERDRDNGKLRVLASGQDAGGGGTQADIRLRAVETEGETELRADADVYLTGRIAQFGRALAGDVSRRMFEQFADSVREVAESGTAPAKPAAAPNALRLAAGTFRARLGAWLRRLRRKRQ